MSESRVDRYQPLKYIGYCMSQLPPDGVETTFEDFVNYAKFQLSLEKGVLMQDKVWELYTDEAILVEYYANIYAKSKEERQKFESTFMGNDEDFSAWADKMIADNQKELTKQAEKLEDTVSFKPETLGE